MRTITAAAALATLRLRESLAAAAVATDAQCYDRLTQASQMLWERPTPIVETVQSNAAVTVTNCVVALSDVGYGSFQKFFTDDPRIATQSYAPIDASAADNDGIHLRVKTDVTSAFVLYRPAYPRYTSTAYSAGTAYAVDDLILYMDGNCYLCLATTTAGESPASTPAKWRVQPVLLRLLDAMIIFAGGCFREGIYQAAEVQANWFDAAERRLENEKRLFSQSYPWAYDSTSGMTNYPYPNRP